MNPQTETTTVVSEAVTTPEAVATEVATEQEDAVAVVQEDAVATEAEEVVAVEQEDAVATEADDALVQTPSAVDEIKASLEPKIEEAKQQVETAAASNPWPLLAAAFALGFVVAWLLF